MANPSPAGDPGAAQVTGRVGTAAILVNSLVALLLGTGITILVHQLGHWVAGALLGSRSVLFAFGVTHEPALTGTDAVIAALAGPVLSLLVGSAMQILQPFRFRGDFAHLLWIWIAVTSLMVAATTLALAPFAGDAATAVTALGWPGWAAWVAAGIGVVAMLGVAREWAVHSVRLCGHSPSRLRCFSWYPWLIALPVQLGLALAMLALAGVQPTLQERNLIVWAGATQTLFAPLSFLFTRRSQELEEPLQVTPVPWWGIVGLVVLVAADLAISGGVVLG